MSGVYVVRRQSGSLKIGVSGNVKVRLGLLQNASHEPLYLDYSEKVEGDAVVLERRTHDMLTAYRLNDEWLDVSTEIAVATIREAAQALGFGLQPWPPKVQRVAPKRGKATGINVRFDPDMLAKIDAAAKRRGTGRAAWIHLAVSRALDGEDNA